MTLENQKKLKVTLTEAHDSYSKGLNARAYFKVSDHTIGQELVQDTFIKTWSYLVKGGKIETMKAFLYHVLNNLIVDQYRKHKTTSLDTILEKGFEPTDNYDYKRLYNILDGKKAFLLIIHLPKKYQKVMRMRYIQSLTLKEMSVITGQSKNTVAVQAHRGLEILKSIYVM